MSERERDIEIEREREKTPTHMQMKDLLHGLCLGGRSDAADGETDVNGGADTLVEELRLEEDLSVGDGDHVGGDVCRHISSLGLNDGQGGERSTSVHVAHLGSTLERTKQERKMRGI